MEFKKVAKTILISGMVLGMIGCNSSGKNTKKSHYSSNEAHMTRVGSIADIVEFYGEEVTPAEERSLLKEKTLYFAFDSYEIDQNNKKIILAHAKKMLENPRIKLRVDGHTDERGSREYNIGLGERRAKAVAKVLAQKGIPSDRVAVVSYGKEKPAVLGHDENSWEKNRRAELAYEES